MRIPFSIEEVHHSIKQAMAVCIPAEGSLNFCKSASIYTLRQQTVVIVRWDWHLHVIASEISASGECQCKRENGQQQIH